MNEQDFKHYRNKNGAKSVFLFSLPRSGSTLILRLMHLACGNEVMGDFTSEFYKSVLSLRKEWHVKEKIADIKKCEVDKVSVSSFRGPAINRFASREKMRDWHLINAINISGACKFTKSTELGYHNNLVEEFCEFLRNSECDTVSDNIQIAFLSRDKLECAESMWNKFGNSFGIKKDEFVDIAVNALDEQHNQFKACMEFGDVIIEYNDLIKDPIKILCKLHPAFYPNIKVINEVISNKIS